MSLPLLWVLVGCPGGGDSGSETDTETAAPLVDERGDELCPNAPSGGGVEAGDALHRVVLTDPAAVCNDGTPGVMYIRPASDPEYADQWVIYTQGGGSCTGFQHCLDRWCGVDYSKAKMSSAFTPQTAGESALFAREEGNPFGLANQVLLYYCSSDQWGGTRADVVMEDPDGVDSPYRLHFRGHEIARAAIDRLMAGPVAADADSSVVLPSLADADRVLWAGASAGGRGAQAHVDWLGERLGDDVELVAWFDGSLPIDYDDLGPDGAALADYDRDVRWPEIYAGLYGQFTDASCAEAHPGDEAWMCMPGPHVVLNHITTPFFARQDLSDPVLGGLYLELGATVPQMASAWALTVDRVVEIASTSEEAEQMTREPGMYAPNCGQHVGINDAEWYSQSTVEDDEGHLFTHRGAFLSWYAGDRLEVLDGQPRDRSVCATVNGDGG